MTFTAKRLQKNLAQTNKQTNIKYKVASHKLFMISLTSRNKNKKHLKDRNKSGAENCLRLHANALACVSDVIAFIQSLLIM